MTKESPALTLALPSDRPTATSNALPYTMLRPEAAVPAVSRPSLAFLDPAVAQAITSYANTGAVPESDLEMLRQATRRPRVATDRFVFRLGPNAPLVLNGNIVGASTDGINHMNVIREERGDRSLEAAERGGGGLRPRLLNTKLSHQEHQEFLKRRVLCTAFMSNISQRLHFIQSDGAITADLEEAQKQHQELYHQESVSVEGRAQLGEAFATAAGVAADVQALPVALACEASGVRDTRDMTSFGARAIVQIPAPPPARTDSIIALLATTGAQQDPVQTHRPWSYTSPPGSVSLSPAPPSATDDADTETAAAATDLAEAEYTRSGGRARGYTVSGVSSGALSLRHRPMGLSAGRRASGWGVKRLTCTNDAHC